MMAIVKATYTRSREAAKASVRYIANRPGEAGKCVVREIYGIDGKLKKLDAYRMIDEAKKDPYSLGWLSARVLKRKTPPKTSVSGRSPQTPC